MRNKIVSIAQAEVGYKEQGTNQTKYGKWYGMQDEWCNIFVSWCANQAGISEDIIPKMAYVPSTANWFDAKGQYKNSKANGGNYIPQAGDIVLFDYNHNTTSDHIGLVERVEGSEVYTIEGNKNNMVQRCRYDLASRDIRAYCVPAYVEEEKKEESEEDDMVEYSNGSTIEDVYETSDFTKKIGRLNAWEKCRGKKIAEGVYLVLYKIDNTNVYKSGFVKYHGGIR